MNNLTDKFLQTDYEEVYTLSGDSSTAVVRSPRTGEFLVRKTVAREYGEIYKLLSTLEIPNIPKVRSITDNGEHSVVIEEFIPGMTLERKIEINGTLLEKDAMKYAADICNALEGLHRKGIVHRDISPSNIVIRSDGTAYLVDFGISRVKKKNQKADTEILGTAGYAAPEQFGFRQTDERTDIYSLGIIMRYMLTGSAEATQISGKIGRIIEKCTQIEPDNRYLNAVELKKLLGGKKAFNIKAPLIAIAVILLVAVVAIPRILKIEAENAAQEYNYNAASGNITSDNVASQDSNTSSDSRSNTDTGEFATLEKYEKVQKGMTYDEVVEIMGSKGKLDTEYGPEDGKISTYVWYGNTDRTASAYVEFQRGAVTDKSAYYLE
ncbi:MAG: serine/threonine protein kinase [Clostridia bacterium]|nr:serine/threonine protein kinase [Clostridia bacterium]